jgi:general secretion pathway protein J
MQPRQAGFTIIEVIVALTVLSLIMLAMVTAMRTLGDTQSRVQAVIDRSDEMRLVSRFLQRNISQAAAVFRRVEGEPESTYFIGTASELIWVAPISAGPAVGGLTIAKIAIQGETLTLQMQIFESPEKEIEWDEVKKYTLVDNAESLVLGYRSNIGADWEEEWVGRRQSPRTVRIIIKQTDRFWPELIIGLDEAVNRGR